MTVDTATLRAQWEAIREQQGAAAFGMIAHVGDGIALLDALAEERERVRVLTEAITAALHTWAERGEGSHAWHVAVSAMVLGIEDALAIAGGEGATT